MPSVENPDDLLKKMTLMTYSIKCSINNKRKTPEKNKDKVMSHHTRPLKSISITLPMLPISKKHKNGQLPTSISTFSKTNLPNSITPE